MTDEHKAAIAQGRAEMSAVSDYLDMLESTKPRPGRRQTPEALQAKLDAISTEIAAAKPVKRLLLMQERSEIEKSLAALQEQPDTSAIEEAFVQHAASFSERKGVEYATWRDYGVDAATLAKAGVTRTRSS